MLPAASAAATLAQLHNHKLDHEWESEVVGSFSSLTFQTQRLQNTNGVHLGLDVR